MTFKLRWKDEETRRKLPGLSTDCESLHQGRELGMTGPRETSGHVAEQVTQESADPRAGSAASGANLVTLGGQLTSELHSFMDVHRGSRECLSRRGLGHLCEFMLGESTLQLLAQRWSFLPAAFLPCFFHLGGGSSPSPPPFLAGCRIPALSPALFNSAFS